MRTKRSSSGRRAVLTCVAVLSLVGCSASPGPAPSRTNVEAPARAAFPADGAFDYQLGTAYDPTPDVQLVVRDREAPPMEGLYNVCYVNAFQTQPGEQRDWPGGTLLIIDGVLAVDPDWPDEVLLDTSTSTKRDTILGIVGPWIEGCARDGYDAVEFDNLDSFTRSHESLTLDDNVALASALSDIAHGVGLAVGQKNAAEHASRLADEAGFDFAISEGCAAFDECAAYTDAYGAAVIDIEYTENLPRDFASLCADSESPPSMILRDRDLVGPDDARFVFEKCAP